MKTKHSRHYGKGEESTRLLSSIRNGYVKYMRELAKLGTREEIISVVNGIHVRLDFEVLMQIETCEDAGIDSSDLFLTPEEFTQIYGEAAGICHIKAINFKNARQSLRTVLREHRMTEAARIIDGWADEVEAFLGE